LSHELGARGSSATFGRTPHADPARPPTSSPPRRVRHAGSPTRPTSPRPAPTAAAGAVPLLRVSVHKSRADAWGHAATSAIRFRGPAAPQWSGAARPRSRATVGVYRRDDLLRLGRRAGPRSVLLSARMPIGGVDDATLLVRGAQKVSTCRRRSPPPLELNLFFRHTSSVDGKEVPRRVSCPWDGSQRADRAHEPATLAAGDRPYGTPSGNKAASLLVVAGRHPGRPSRCPSRSSRDPAEPNRPRQPVTASISRRSRTRTRRPSSTRLAD